MADTLRILHTEASCGWGGQEIRVLDEAQGCIERGHTVWIAGQPHSQIVPASRKRGIETASVNHPLCDTPLAVLPTTTAWLSEVWEFALPEYLEAIAALGIRPADELARFRMHAEAIEL